MPAYRYDDEQFVPPAPVLEVQISHVQRPQLPNSQRALLDTGADITAIPIVMAKRLKLTRVGKIQIEGVEGTQAISQTYAARLYLAGQEISWLEVVLTGLDFVILGRDVLNLLNIQLNGPGQMLVVS